MASRPPPDAADAAPLTAEAVVAAAEAALQEQLDEAGFPGKRVRDVAPFVAVHARPCGDPAGGGREFRVTFTVGTHFALPFGTRSVRGATVLLQEVADGGARRRPPPRRGTADVDPRLVFRQSSFSAENNGPPEGPVAALTAVAQSHPSVRALLALMAEQVPKSEYLASPPPGPPRFPGARGSAVFYERADGTITATMHTSSTVGYGTFHREEGDKGRWTDLRHKHKARGSGSDGDADGWAPFGEYAAAAAALACDDDA